MVRFLAEERGATSAEFALIAALVGLGIFVAVPGLPDLLAHKFSSAMSALPDFTWAFRF